MHTNVNNKSAQHSNNHWDRFYRLGNPRDSLAWEVRATWDPEHSPGVARILSARSDIAGGFTMVRPVLLGGSVITYSTWNCQGQGPALESSTHRGHRDVSDQWSCDVPQLVVA